MDDTELRKLLEQVHDEVKNTKAVDSKGAEVLKRLDKDLESIRDCPEGKPLAVDESFLQRLREARDHFEVTHPGLTANLSKLLNTLSIVGV